MHRNPPCQTRNARSPRPVLRPRTCRVASGNAFALAATPAFVSLIEKRAGNRPRIERLDVPQQSQLSRDRPLRSKLYLEDVAGLRNPEYAFALWEFPKDPAYDDL